MIGGYEETLSLLHSFYDFSYIRTLPITSITKLLVKANEKQLDKLLWERWIMIYPYMELKQLPFMSFEAYKDKLINKNSKTTNKSKEEIEEEILNIVALHERR